MNWQHYTKRLKRLQLALDQRELKVRKKTEAEKQAEELKKQLPDATQSVDKSILKTLEAKQADLNKIEEDISALIRKKRIVEGAVESYVAIKRNTTQEISVLQKQLINAGVVEDVVKKLMPSWSPDTDKLLNTEIEKISNHINTLKGQEDDPDGTNSLTAVRREIGRLREVVSKDEVSKKRLLDLQQKIAEKTATAERLGKEIKNLDDKVKRDLEKKKSRQIELYLEIFDSLKADEEGLRELYSPMEEAINQLGTDMQFSVSVGYKIDAKSWLSQSGRFFDGRRTGADAKRDEIEKIVETKLVRAWKSGETIKIKEAIGEFLGAVDVNTFPSKYGIAKLTK